MPEFDLAIRGGTVVTASDTVRADVGVRGGRIVAVAEGIADAARVIDASGLLVLPGGIDSHVHIAQESGPGIVMADDFASATRAAAAGGNTCVMPFALQPRGASLRGAVDAYRARAEGQCHVDVAIHMIISDPSEAVLGQELPALVADGYTSFKVFMTYDDLVLNDRQLLDVFHVARRQGARVMVHAEGYDAIRYLSERLERAGETRPYGHALSRPEIVEREAAHRAISHAELIDLPIVIVHVSGREATEQIAWAQARGLKIRAETCPQYLTLTAEDMKGLGQEDLMAGAKYVCSPPTRDVESQEAVWSGIRRGIFDVVSSDHCPFRYDDPQGKLNPRGKTSFRWIPNGIPGIETRLPVFFLGRGLEGADQPQPVRRADRHQPRQAVRALPAQGLDRSGLRRRPHALGSEPARDHPPGEPAPRLRLHAVGRLRRHRLAGGDDHGRAGDRRGRPGPVRAGPRAGARPGR